MNPYTPSDAGIDDETADTKPQLNSTVSNPIRTFAIAVFVGMFFAGPFVTTHPISVLTCVVAFGLTAVWFDRVYDRS